MTDISPIDKIVYIAEHISDGDSTVQMILTTALAHGLEKYHLNKMYNIIKLKQ